MENVSGYTIHHGHELRRRHSPVFPNLTQTKCLPVWILPSFPTSLFGAHTCLSVCLFDWLAVCLTWYFLLVPVSFLVPVCLSGPWRPVRPVLLSVDVQFKSGLTFSPDLLLPPFLFLVKFRETLLNFSCETCSSFSPFPADPQHVTDCDCWKTQDDHFFFLFYWFYVLICLFQVHYEENLLLLLSVSVCDLWPPAFKAGDLEVEAFCVFALAAVRFKGECQQRKRGLNSNKRNKQSGFKES